MELLLKQLFCRERFQVMQGRKTILNLKKKYAILFYFVTFQATFVRVLKAVTVSITVLRKYEIKKTPSYNYFVACPNKSYTVWSALFRFCQNN